MNVCLRYGHGGVAPTMAEKAMLVGPRHIDKIYAPPSRDDIITQHRLSGGHMIYRTCERVFLFMVTTWSSRFLIDNLNLSFI